MSSLGLNDVQKRVKELAEGIMFKTKIERRVILSEMTALNQQLTTDEQLQVVLAIDSAPALRFLAATGIRGDARDAMFAKLANLERQGFNKPLERS